jgi:translation initiation factor 3 subunit L
MQHQKLLANEDAFAAIPDPVKRVRSHHLTAPSESVTKHRRPQFIVHFHQAVLKNNLAEITVAYETGWNRLTEKFYAKTEWPDADLIAPLVGNGSWPPHRH